MSNGFNLTNRSEKVVAYIYSRSAHISIILGYFSDFKDDILVSLTVKMVHRASMTTLIGF